MIPGATCHSSYASNAPISAVMRWRSRSGYTQWITREEYAFEPRTPVVEYADNFGSLCWQVLIPEGKVDVRYSCRAHTADAVVVERTTMKVTVDKAP